jgi:hypothetical protein
MVVTMHEGLKDLVSHTKIIYIFLTFGNNGRVQYEAHGRFHFANQSVSKNEKFLSKKSFKKNSNCSLSQDLKMGNVLYRAKFGRISDIANDNMQMSRHNEQTAIELF